MVRVHLRGPGIISLAFLLSGVVAQSRAADTATMPYEKLAALQDAFLAIPAAERDRISFAWTVKRNDAADRRPIHMWVDDDGHRADLAIGADGAIALPVRPDWVARHLAVQTDLPHHTASITIGLLIDPMPGTDWPVAELLKAVTQAQGAVRVGARQMGGMLALLAVPTLRQVRITLAGCCAQTARLTGAPGDVSFGQDAHGVVSVPLAALQDRPGATLRLSAPATRVDPEAE